MRKLIGEWWELRWRHNGEDWLVNSGWNQPPSGVRPFGTYDTKKAAFAAKKLADNKHHAVIRVRRYEVEKEKKERLVTGRPWCTTCGHAQEDHVISSQHSECHAQDVGSPSSCNCNNYREAEGEKKA